MSTHKKAHELQVRHDKSGQSVMPYEPTFEEIRASAYEVYVQRGRIDGFDIEHWLQAEKELRQIGNKVKKNKVYVKVSTAELESLVHHRYFAWIRPRVGSGHPYRG